MENRHDIISRINEKYGSMSKGHKAIASYIMDHYDQAAFMTAAKLGKTLGISESTVVRFAAGIGYEGYPQMQKALAAWVKGKLNTVDSMDIKYAGSSQSEVLTSVLSSDIEKLRHTIDHLDPAAFETAVDLILEAKTVYILGIRSCEPLAGFLSFYLNMIRGNVVQIKTTSTSEVFEQMIRHQLPAVFDAYPEGDGVCKRQKRQGNHDHGQHPFPHEPVFLLQPSGKKRHGFHCGFPGGSPFCHQRACSRIVPEMSGAGAEESGIAGRGMEQLSGIFKRRDQLYQ